MWHSRQGSGNTFLHISLFTMDDYSDKTGLYGVVSDGHIFGLFIPSIPAVMRGFNQEAYISLEVGFGQFCFSVLCSCVPLRVPKHLDSCSTFNKAIVASRAFPSHFVSWF